MQLSSALALQEQISTFHAFHMWSPPMFWVFDPSHVDCVIKVLEICQLWSVDWARPLHEHHSQFSFQSFVLGTNWALFWIIWALRLTPIGDMDGIEHVYALCNTCGRFAQTYQRVSHSSTVFSCWVLSSYLAYLAQDDVREWQLGHERYSILWQHTSNEKYLVSDEQ